MKLEEGMYVRTKYGYIGKILKIKEFSIYFDAKIFNASNYTSRHQKILSKEKINQITKASHNIIDLIEVGDYVNGCYVEDVKETFVNIATGSNYFQRPSIFEEDIKSIVTKEQFESMSYKVGNER